MKEVAAYGGPDLTAVIGEACGELVACDCAVVWYVFEYGGSLGAEAEAPAVNRLRFTPLVYTNKGIHISVSIR